MRNSVVDLVKTVVGFMPDWPGRTVYEIGSRQVEGGGGFDLRGLFRAADYVGVDVVTGPGVDLVQDLSVNELALMHKAGVLMCLETLEHAPDPFRLSLGLRHTLLGDGWGLITTPFNFPVHSRPDYWRFTPDGMENMLKRAGFDRMLIFASVPVGDPDTVAALVWKKGLDGFFDENLGEIKVQLDAWAVRCGREARPGKGDRYLECQHSDRRWRETSDRIVYTRPGGGTEATRWLYVCQPCMVQAGGEVNRISFSGEGVAE